MEPEADPVAAPAWATEDIHVVGYDPAWADRAAVFAGEIRGLLAGWLTGPIIHVGSTAVPRLPAKPIIDLQATAPDPATATAARGEAMAAASWFVVPSELDQRPWRWFVVRADATGRHRLAHLHLMQPGEPRWDQQLVFRDRLRTDPALLQEYAHLKATAAHQHRHDREAYTQAKYAFVRRILHQSSGGSAGPGQF